MKKVLFSLALVLIAGSMSAQSNAPKSASIKAEPVKLNPNKRVVLKSKAINTEAKEVKTTEEAEVKSPAKKEETTTTK